MTITVPDYLRNFVRDRSHAIAEECFRYDDETPLSDEEPMTQGDILMSTLDSLDGIAQAEYRVLVNTHGEDATRLALLAHTVDP